jgi:hypothetical protein
MQAGAALSAAVNKYHEFAKEDKFIEPKNEQDENRQGTIERFIGRNRGPVFNSSPSLKDADKADIEGSINRELFDRTVRHAGFAKALLSPANERAVRQQLTKGIAREFNGRNVSKMELKDIDAITRELSKDLANQITPKEQNVAKKKAVGIGSR